MTAKAQNNCCHLKLISVVLPLLPFQRYINPDWGLTWDEARTVLTRSKLVLFIFLGSEVVSVLSVEEKKRVTPAVEFMPFIYPMHHS